MANKRGYSVGFTLIEVLLALTIMSLTMVSGTYFFQFVSNNWQRAKAEVSGAESRFYNWQLVTEALHGTIPKLAYPEQDSSVGDVGFYFLGREDGFTGFTSSSVQDPNHPAVYRLFIEEASGGESLRLVYEEAVVDGFALVHGAQELPFNYRVIVWRDLSSIKFTYTGWESFDMRMEQAVNETGFELIFDYNEYDGLVRRQHPLFITIELDNFDWTLSIPDVSNELISNSVSYDI